MAYQVYRIMAFAVPNNSHKINRDENWEVKKDKAFTTEAEAKQYIIEQSVQKTDLLLFCQSCSPEKKEAFKEEFCFTNDTYLRYRRFFLGYPPTKEIRKALEKDGVRVIKVN